jgi:uncharacterized protein YkwD
MKNVVCKADSLDMPRRAVRLVTLVALVLSASSLVSAAGATTESRSTAMQSLEAGLLVDVNNLRRTHGLVALRLSSKLSLAARQHSMEMAARGYFSHSSADGSHFDRRIARFYPMGNRRYWSVGENLLWSSPDVDAAGALQMWLDSPEHRANLLTPRWREIGLSAVHAASAPGTYHGREVTIVTADFGVRR